MTLLLRLCIAASLGLLACAGQIPVVDGVIGGVPTTKINVESSLPQPQVSGTPVAGKLRFIKDSGVCGQLFASSLGSSDLTDCGQRRHRVSFRHQDMRISLRLRACGV